jgi:hypothetical protein
MKSFKNKAINLNIVTNNPQISRFYNKHFMVFIDKVLVNAKFRITKLLTIAFAILPIPIKMQNKYYYKIRDLLVIQYKLIIN